MLPDAPAPPSLPDLTHRGLALGFDGYLASIKPHDSITGAQPRSFSWFTRLEAEQSISQRSWYLGAAQELAHAYPPGGKASETILGYPEIWGRAVWASRSGLAYGGGLSLVLPLFQRGADSSESVVSQSVRVVRPWSFAPYAENTFTATPFLDARVIDGRVVLQLRQGFALQGLVAQARLPKANVVSQTTAYFGYQVSNLLALGLEMSEVYFISTDLGAICQSNRSGCDDSLRAVFSMSPAVRLLTRRFQPSLSMLFPFERTLFDQVQSYWAVRLTVGIILDDDVPN